MASAEIHETKFMSEALSQARPGDIVVLDIDNTTLEPNQSLASDQWYGYTVEQYQRGGFSPDESIDRAIARVLQVQPKTGVHPVELDTPGLIRDLQKRGIAVYFLTARPTELKETTLRQLNSIGIQPNSGGLKFTNDKEIELYHGVLLVGPRNNKGRILAQFLDEKALKPNKLIFVDDKEHHVKNMEAVLSQRGIVNLNYRYGAADEKVKSFRPQITDIQWSHFEKTGMILSDEEAESLMK